MNCAVFFYHRRIFTKLADIKTPQDLKNVSEEKLPELAAEIRDKIIRTVAKNGGHLASNLGVVELTIALHRVFDSPNDAIVFDVSHQCYAHKLLTGRYQEFDTLRKKGGISGFTKKAESVHDFFDNGHSSTSISQGLGLLTAWELAGHDGKVVAVIGDGALTGGMAFEAMSHAGQINRNLIVILNDNQMSISANTGALSRYLSTLTMTSFYQKFRYTVDGIVDKIPYSEHHLGKFIFRIKRAVKGFFLNTNLFTDLGFEYVGPLDGHNIKEMEENLKRVRKLRKPVVVHILTKKGKGYFPAEEDPSVFHGIGPFNIEDGLVEQNAPVGSVTFTGSFGKSIQDIAEKNKKICAITAAMAKGTGLEAFSKRFTDRFFDVGIAEEHAVTFASGLAAGGMVPVVAIYSTFIQRGIDQIIHDVALQNLPVVLAFDRSGVVPCDGETHQGLFDVPLLRPVPNMIILSPASSCDLSVCLDWAVSCGRPVAIRYPKAACPAEIPVFSSKIEEGRGILVKTEDFAEEDAGADTGVESAKKILFVCTGGMYGETLAAAKILLEDGISSDIYLLRFIKPLDEDFFLELALSYGGVVFVEDSVRNGSAGEYLESVLLKKGYMNTVVKAFPDRFLAHGSRSQICADCEMSPDDIASAAKTLI